MATDTITMAATAVNKAAFLRWIEEGWNGGNVNVVDDLYTLSYVSHSFGGLFPGNRAGLKQFVTMFRTAIPDIHFTSEDLIAEGDRVVMRFRATGTQQGEFAGIPPTGKSFAVSGMLLARFEDGKWAEDWVNWDQLGMLQQLGAVPTPGQ